MKASSRSRAFTLMELVVVTGIICLLAAMLFPVFARAREKARSTECLSNQKQISLAVIQYTQDYDGTVPPDYYCDSQGELAFAGRCVNPFGTYTWVYCIGPYVDDGNAPYHCPDAEKDPYGIYSDTPEYRYPTYEELPMYGYNYAYLTPEDSALYDGCPDDAGYVGPDGIVAPVKESQIEQPARTVLFTDVKSVGTDGTGYYPGWGSDPPVTGNACYWNGWGSGSPGDSPMVGGWPTGTGNVDPRHSGGVNVSFCDGHVKWLTPGSLAAGTNWYIGITNSDPYFHITNLDQDLWSLKKSGHNDL
jgi:prepilin-type processing-associated H-X9-DG protein